jgi:glycyl-tRNA synthetase beta chain
MSTVSRPSPRSNRHEHLDVGNWKLETGGTTSVLVEGGADLTATVPNPEARSPKSRTLPLLIEIGCEEIPARFLAEAQKGLEERLREALKDAKLLPLHTHPLSPGERVVPCPAGPGEGPSDAGHRTPDSQTLQSYSTPRRLVAYLSEVLDKQPDKEEEVRGPAVRAAFDTHGKPTTAAESFAAKHGAEVQGLVKVSTAKGEYVAVRKSVAGRSALEVLPEIFPNVVTGLSFRKSMYWEKSKTRFIRPIRWLLTLLGEGENAQVVHFEVAGVRSGKETRGHRILDSSPISVNSFEEYSKQLRESLVEFDPEKRREQVRKEIQALLETSRLSLIEDRGLEEWVVNSTEWPGVLLGSFDKRFLKLPREILITVMRDHQKYFALEDAAGNLQPKFIASLNLDSDPKGHIRAGHERVLTARFSDAEFFWTADQRILLRDRLPMLERVTYQAKLGSYGDKVRRMEAIADKICRSLAVAYPYSVSRSGATDQEHFLGAVRSGAYPCPVSRADAPDREHVLGAIRLCKCDLTTQMVQEFTELQGVVGGLYAREQGEPEAVWQAIYDHYLPLSADGQSPRTVFGAVVSLADKLDSVIAGFSAGFEPTGSSDPFGLRRAGNGIVKVTVDLLPGLDLLDLLKQITEANLGLPPVTDLFGQVASFLRERTESYLETIAGLRYDTVRAVVRSFLAWTPPADALGRGKALDRIRDSEDFVALATAAKRTRNILTKSAKADDLAGTVEPIDEELLTAGPEEELYCTYNRLRPTVDELAARGEYEDAFRVLAGLRPQVDRFFDKVLVMDDDLRVRRNRLNLLSKLDLWVFRRFADLSQIESTASSPVDAPTSKTVASDKGPVTSQEPRTKN